MNWTGLTNWFGGKAHFANVAGLALISVGFYLKTDPQNFPTYAGCVMAICGFQNWRSAKDGPSNPG